MLGELDDLIHGFDANISFDKSQNSLSKGIITGTGACRGSLTRSISTIVAGTSQPRTCCLGGFFISLEGS